MMLITKELEKKLPRLYATEGQKDPVAYLKLFTAWTHFTFYVTEYDPATGLCFGLINGLVTELGYLSLTELEQIRGAGGLGVERDLYFKPTPLSEIRKQLCVSY